MCVSVCVRMMLVFKWIQFALLNCIPCTQANFDSFFVIDAFFLQHSRTPIIGYLVDGTDKVGCLHQVLFRPQSFSASVALWDQCCVYASLHKGQDCGINQFLALLLACGLWCKHGSDSLGCSCRKLFATRLVEAVLVTGGHEPFSYEHKTLLAHLLLHCCRSQTAVVSARWRTRAPCCVPWWRSWCCGWLGLLLLPPSSASPAPPVWPPAAFLIQPPGQIRCRSKSVWAKGQSGNSHGHRWNHWTKVSSSLFLPFHPFSPPPLYESHC